MLNSGPLIWNAFSLGRSTIEGAKGKMVAASHTPGRRNPTRDRRRVAKIKTSIVAVTLHSI